MTLKTDWNKCEFYPDNKKERKLILDLYDMLNKEYSKDIQLSGSEDTIFLTIETYF